MKRIFPNIELIFNNLSSGEDKEEVKQRKTETATGSDCELFKTNPPKVPEKFLSLSADIPQLEKVNANILYQGKVYEQQINPEVEDGSKVDEDTWSDDEQRNFQSHCRRQKKIKIKRLKRKLPNKTAREIVQHYYIFYQPKKKWTNRQI